MKDSDGSGNSETGIEPAPRADRALYGPDLPGVEIDLNLASLLQASGDLAGAEECFERALRIAEKAQGPEQPDMDSRF